MTTPTLIVAANGYTRDQVALTITLDEHDGQWPWFLSDGKYITLAPIPTIHAYPFEQGIVRFVTDNDLDDGVFQVIGQE